MPNRPTRNQPDGMPTRKVIVGAVAALGTALVIGVLHRGFGYTPDPDVAAAIAALVYGGTSYAIPEWDDRGHGSSG
jgi:hypothetical protein